MRKFFDMPITRTFILSFNPAQREGGSTYSVSMKMGEPKIEHEVTVSTLDEFEREIRRLALGFGQTCKPWIRLKDRHDGNFVGFYAWLDKLGVIDFPPKV